MEQTKETKEFYAFISYKREDERWARWLQHRLEHYRLPANLNGRTDLPKEIRPIFRDTSELLPGNLPQQINDALAASRHLIVICSPHSAQSVWVNKEIETFIAMGKQANIIPFIVDGHPFAQKPDEECFPVAIRNLPSEQELLGANVAEMGREAAAVKTVARMFGIRFDTLWGRYQREQKRRRNWIIAAGVTAFLIVLGVAGYIWKQNDDFRHAISRAAAKEAMQLIEQGDGYTAQRVALAALDKAYTPEAEYALRQATQCRSTVLRGHTANVYEAIFSPDGKQITTSSFDGTIRIWDVNTGQCLKTKVKHDDSERHSPNLKYTLSSSIDSIRLWDVSTGQCLWAKKAQNADFISTFSSDEHSVIANTGDSTISILDVPTGKCIKELRTPSTAHFARISPDGKYLACSINDANLFGICDNDTIIWGPQRFELYEIASGKLIHSVLLDNYIEDIAFSPNDKKILALGGGALYIFDLTSGKCLNKLTDRCYPAAYSPDGKYIASGDWDGNIRLSDAVSMKVLRTLKGHTNTVEAIVFSPDGKYIASTSRDKTIFIWELDSLTYTLRTKLNTNNNYGNGWYTRHSHNYKYVTRPVSNTLRIWDATTGEMLPSCFPYTYSSYTISTNNRQIVIVCDDSTLRTYDIATGKCLRTFIGHTGYVSTVAYSPNDKYIVSGASDSTLRIWDATTGKCLQTLKGHENDITSVAYSLDGNQIVSTSYDENTIRIWNAATGQNPLTINNLECKPIAAIFNPDGKRILITLDNFTMLIYDAITGRPTKTLSGHTDEIESAEFSPNGKYVVSSDGTEVRVWDASTGHCLQKLPEAIMGPAFSSDGKYIQFLMDDYFEGAMRFSLCTWDFPPLEELKAQVRSRFKDNPLTPEERRQYYLE